MNRIDKVVILDDTDNSGLEKQINTIIERYKGSYLIKIDYHNAHHYNPQSRINVFTCTAVLCFVEEIE